MDHVEVPHTALDQDTLRRVIEHFVLSEGTDYGHTEYSLESKYLAVLQQIQRNQVKIVYDRVSDSVFIVRAD